MRTNSRNFEVAQYLQLTAGEQAQEQPSSSEPLQPDVSITLKTMPTVMEYISTQK